MTYRKETSLGFESRKCRDRNLNYLQSGTIFDLGCGNEKVVPKAIGIDIASMIAELKLDLSDPQSMYMFNESIADVVFSSHLLEHFQDTEEILKSWWRVIKPNGYLILYLPHKDLYPKEANPDHKHEFAPVDIVDILDKFASYKLIRATTHSEDNEYSFEIVAQKIMSPEQIIVNIEKPKESGKKKCQILRYGAVGDMLAITPLLKQLKTDGYEVHLVCTPRTAPIENNPNIDFVYTQERGIIPSLQLAEYHKTISKGYDKVINLCGSIESSLLFEYASKEYFLTKEERHKIANVNYYDRTMELGGYPDIKGTRGEMYISDSEQSLIKLWQKKHEGFFKIMIQVRGSSEHKIYPYISDIADELVGKYNDIRIFLVGGIETQVLDWVHPNIRSCIGKWNERQALIMTSAMDLVISPESGILNAAGCFDTPKIGLLTHSSKENLTKYFINDYSIESEAECAPCHRLVHKTVECKTGAEYMLPVCMERGIPPAKVMTNIELVYNKWKAI